MEHVAGIDRAARGAILSNFGMWRLRKGKQVRATTGKWLRLVRKNRQVCLSAEGIVLATLVLLRQIVVNSSCDRFLLPHKVYQLSTGSEAPLAPEWLQQDHHNHQKNCYARIQSSIFHFCLPNDVLFDKREKLLRENFDLNLKSY